jgi:parallel beta-helix repeat protein
MGSILQPAETTFFDAIGFPLVGGKVFFYQPNTENPATTWKDSMLATPNTNPVILDAAGRAIIWGNTTYRQVVQDRFGNTIWDQIVTTNVSSTDLSGTGGAALIGLPDGSTLASAFLTNLNHVVDSIALLRAVNHAFYARVFVTGYYAPHDGGGGPYQYDPDDTTSADNGGTIIVATDGARWKLSAYGAISLKQFGAKIDGTTDDSTAVASAINNAVDVYHPGGNCLVGPLAFSNLTSHRIKGVSRRESLFKLASTGTMFDFSTCSDCQLIDLGFQPNGTIANANGVVFDTGGGINTVDRCEFDDFSLAGLTFLGTVDQQQSGNTLSNSLLLGCGVNNFLSIYSDDFFYHNNQFGVTKTGVVPQVGAYLQNSSAGTYSENYHWGNTVGFRHVDCNYNRIEDNRFEESKQQGAYLSGCTRTIFSGNTIHTNSQQTLGAYDNAYFTNCDTLIVSGNDSFDWNSGATAHRYAFFFDVGCAAVEVKGNSAPQGWTIAPYGFDPSLATAKLQGDTSIFSVSGGSAIPAGQTTFFGAGISNFNQDAVQIISGRQSQLYRIAVYSDNAPGAGESYTYTLYKNGAATATVLTIAGASSFVSEIIQNGMTLLESDSYCLQLVASGAAATAYHRASFSQVDY